MKKLKQGFLGLFKRCNNKIERFGYPIVTLTAPKNGIRFKVDIHDPNFDKPIENLTKHYF